MKIVLLGSTGQVAFRLSQALAPLGDLKVLGRDQVDYTNLPQLRERLRAEKPNFIVNAVAHTAVDRAETTEVDLAFLVNAEAVQVIAELAAELGAWLIHYSTDYVFDGQKSTAYLETDVLSPLNRYGQAKAQAEAYIQMALEKAIILRVSWVFDAYGQNFPKTILRLAQERDSLRVIDDQWGSPTSAHLIASVTALIVYRLQMRGLQAKELAGIYHLSPSGRVSWHGFAKQLIDQAWKQGMRLRCGTDHVLAIPATEYPLPAKRPHNSCLDSRKLETHFGVKLPPWEAAIDPFLRELRFMGWLKSPQN